jgi:hypothetical protein
MSDVQSIAKPFSVFPATRKMKMNSSILVNGNVTVISVSVIDDVTLDTNMPGITKVPGDESW